MDGLHNLHQIMLKVRKHESKHRHHVVMLTPEQITSDEDGYSGHLIEGQARAEEAGDLEPIYSTGKWALFHNLTICEMRKTQDTEAL